MSLISFSSYCPSNIDFLNLFFTFYVIKCYFYRSTPILFYIQDRKNDEPDSRVVKEQASLTKPSYTELATNVALEINNNTNNLKMMICHLRIIEIYGFIINVFKAKFSNPLRLALRCYFIKSQGLPYETRSRVSFKTEIVINA